MDGEKTKKMDQKFKESYQKLLNIQIFQIEG